MFSCMGCLKHIFLDAMCCFFASWVVAIIGARWSATFISFRWKVSRVKKEKTGGYREPYSQSCEASGFAVKQWETGSLSALIVIVRRRFVYLIFSCLCEPGARIRDM